MHRSQTNRPSSVVCGPALPSRESGLTRLQLTNCFTRSLFPIWSSGPVCLSVPGG